MESDSNLHTTSKTKSASETKLPVPYGLVDVDFTIINMDWLKNKDENSLYNEALLDAYQELGIKDIRIFTNMKLDTLNAEFDPLQGLPVSRYQIVEELTKRGFIVHEVVTPADLGLGNKMGAFYEQMYLPQHARFVKEILKPHSSYDDKEFYGVYQAFKKASNEGSSPEKFEEFCKKLGIEVKNLRDFNIKGLLYDFMLRNETQPFGMAVYADDEAGCRNTVQTVDTQLTKQNPDKKHDLVIIAVDQKEDFKIANYETKKAAYKEQILKAIQEKAPEQLQALEEGRKHFAEFTLFNLKKGIFDRNPQTLKASPSAIQMLSFEQKLELLSKLSSAMIGEKDEVVSAMRKLIINLTSSLQISQEEIKKLTNEQKIEYIQKLHAMMMRIVSNEDQFSRKEIFNATRYIPSLMEDIFHGTKFTTDDESHLKQIILKSQKYQDKLLEQLQQTSYIELGIEKLQAINKQYTELMATEIKESGLFGSSRAREERAKTIEGLQSSFMSALKSTPHQYLKDPRIKEMFNDLDSIIYSKTKLIGGTIKQEAFAALEPPKKPSPGGKKGLV